MMRRAALIYFLSQHFLGAQAFVVVHGSYTQTFLGVPHEQNISPPSPRVLSVTTNAEDVGTILAPRVDSAAEDQSDLPKTRVVVIGDGMVGQRFMEDLLEYDSNGDRLHVTTFCEEPHAAYNRVRLTSYFETHNASALSLT